MTQIEAVYFDGASAKKQKVVLEFEGGDFLILKKESGEIWKYQPWNFEILPPLGKTERVIRFSDGGQCEVSDLSAFSKFESQFVKPGRTWVHSFEKSLLGISAAVVVFICFCACAYLYGIPWLAKDMAFRLSPSIRESVTNQAVDALDGRMFEETKLDQADQDRVHRIKDIVFSYYPKDYNYRLLLRSSKIGANAFALPDGRIFMTDELVNLAENDMQIAAVLAHEVGHVLEQHGMRMVLQDAGLMVLVTALTGDVSAWTSFGAILPTMIARNAYSREFEIEADVYAVEYLRDQGEDAEAISRILHLMAEEHGGKDIPLEGVLSTHPTLKDRVKALEQISEEH